MEALAEPGKAYLTEDAAALAGGYLDLEDLGEFEIKGASRPVRVFELAGVGAARSRLDLARERGFSRFVGRAAEMEALEAALARADAGEGGAVGLIAEPGVGKSRLSHEFAERCREAGVEVFEAQAQAHGQAIPFMPVLQMLRSFFGIGESEPEQLAREKIAGRALLLDPEFSADLPLLFDFLGVPDPDRPVPQMSAEARQRALGQIVCRLVNAPVRRKTLVLVIEDLHWIDEASNAMLAGLIESIAGTRTLAVVNYRPEYEPPWGRSPLYRGIPLAPLERADTAELLRDLAGEDPSLDGLDEPIHERTQGNPFFIEEIVRELAESSHLEGERGAYRLVAPIEDAAVPVTVQAILAARIDRLDPEAKQLLQVASVVGKELSARALGLTAGLEQESIDPVLCQLTEAGFLYEAEIYPQRVLAFRHPLTREVAYGTQLADRRRQTHAAAARATIELEPERLDELAGLVAHHMEEGGETLEAARWFARAAHWAGHSQPRDALRLWQRVTALADQLEEDEETLALALLSRMLQLEYAWRLGMDPAEAEALAAEAAAIAERCGDLNSLTLLKLLTGARPGVAGTSTEWVAAAEEAIELAERAGDPALRIARPRRRRLRPYLRRRPRSARCRRRGDAGALGRRPRARRRDRRRQPAGLGPGGEGDVPARAGAPRGGGGAAAGSARDRPRAGGPGDRELGPGHDEHGARRPRRHRGGAGAGPAQPRADRAARRRLLAQHRAHRRQLRAVPRRPARGGAGRGGAGRPPLPRGDAPRRRERGLALGPAGAGAAGAGAPGAGAGGGRVGGGDGPAARDGLAGPSRPPRSRPGPRRARRARGSRRRWPRAPSTPGPAATCWR